MFSSIMCSFDQKAFPASTSDEMSELFQYISRYKPQEHELEIELKPFIPEYIPTIGDIDAFIKVCGWGNWTGGDF